MFKWQVLCTLCRQDRIVSGVNKRVRKFTHKHGVELLTPVSYTKNLGEKNGNTLWVDTTSKEINNLKAAFCILEDGSKVLVSHDNSSVHLVFDLCVNLERESMWVKYRCKNPAPEQSVFSSVVSRESVYIALTYSLLN